MWIFLAKVFEPLWVRADAGGEGSGNGGNGGNGSSVKSTVQWNEKPTTALAILLRFHLKSKRESSKS